MATLKIRTILATLGSLALLQGAPAMAAMQTFDFDSGSQSFSGNGNGNTLTMSSGGVGLTVRAYSDTGDVSGDDIVEAARLLWAQSSALGIQNDDENTSSPNHSIDSVSGDSDGEFDMLLLEFDTEVNLEGIDLSWATDGGGNYADVSILAYDGTGGFSPLGGTWADVLSSNGGNYNSVGNYNNVGLSYYAVNGADVTSTAWLVGVYNPVFGSGSGLDSGDDGMKLSLIKTSTPDDQPPGEVPVPGSLPLMLLGLVLLRGRFAALRAAA
ncbi:MAG: hypothetical protein CME59_10025 [Halioglobus sp.]|nr:hypothetical protein [Halioglobus sp.]|tara:strand:- start:1389 stop:2195 length:807 start_codon:yes stop_codon:yes gene_type:complete